MANTSGMKTAFERDNIFKIQYNYEFSQISTIEQMAI